MIRGYAIADLVACAQFSTAGGAYAAAFERNCSGVYTGVGIATLTLDQAIDTTNLLAVCTSLAANPQIVSVENSTDTAKVIHIDAHDGTNTEGAVMVAFYRVTPLG